MKEIILTHTLLNKKFVGDDSIVVDIGLNKKFVACVINMGKKMFECQSTAIDQY